MHSGADGGHSKALFNTPFLVSFLLPLVIAGCMVKEEVLKSESSNLVQTEHTRQSGFSVPSCQGESRMFMYCSAKGTRGLKASYSILPGNWDFLLAYPVSVDPAET